jgi:hypothetical protein
MRVAVCGSAHDSVRAVRKIVCIGVLGSVGQCARQCAALFGSAAVCGGVRQCAAVRQFAIYINRQGATLWGVPETFSFVVYNL